MNLDQLKTKTTAFKDRVSELDNKVMPYKDKQGFKLSTTAMDKLKKQQLIDLTVEFSDALQKGKSLVSSLAEVVTNDAQTIKSLHEEIKIQKSATQKDILTNILPEVVKAVVDEHKSLSKKNGIYLMIFQS